MQLILDVDNIDVERNMSTIEQEPLNEKFISTKVIDHVDDTTTGNKENIQKRENILVDIEEENLIDTEKDIPANETEILTNNLNEDTTDTGNALDHEVIIDDKSNPKEAPNVLLSQNINKEKPVLEHNEEKLDVPICSGVAKTELGEEDETDAVIPNKKSLVDDTETVKEKDIIEILTEPNDENDLDKEVDISELSKELNEEKEMDLDKEVDIDEVSTELNKERAIEIDDMDIAEVPSESNEEKNIQMEDPDIAEVLTEFNEGKDIEMDIAEVSTALHEVKAIEVDDSVDLTKQPVPDEVRNTNLGEETQKLNCFKLESTPINNIHEKNTAIEIDDEDEKICEVNAQSDQNVEDFDSNKNEGESIEDNMPKDTTVKKTAEEPTVPKRICRLSNNLDIFSDEEEDTPDEESPKDDIQPVSEKQCINIDDDDDIMLVDEDTGVKESKKEDTLQEILDKNPITNNDQTVTETTNQLENETSCTETEQDSKAIQDTLPCVTENQDIGAPSSESLDVPVKESNKTALDKSEEEEKVKKPLLPKDFINTCKKNLSDMTRSDLEEFCILKIVESIVDRSNLGEIKAHLKNLTQTMEDCKKKCLMLTKQNKDLQIVLKSVQEEQKSGSDVHITPLKITRSVGMQVVMVADKNNIRKKPINGVGPQTPSPNTNTKPVRNPIVQNTRNQKDKSPMNQQIPVPRLVPATPPAAKTNQTAINTTAAKQISNTAVPNGIKNSPPVQKVVEKRGRSQAVTVDLTDDEPPAKLQNVQRGPMHQAMRVLTTGPNLIPTQRFTQNLNSPRKVYIPISGPQAQNVRPGQTIMLKTLSSLGPRPRPQSQAQAQALITKAPQTPNPVRYPRNQPNRHPAPLPDPMKQYQPPNWKSLPPAPDLKLSKVENGIIISWKIEGYQEDNHEEIASYQLYAYQETTSPPNTALWKKIGDVKALPLPMACTLTQFMAGYKYYFAVRAVDIRSRFGPFSLPGSILLLNKM